MGMPVKVHADERLVAIILTGNLERHQSAHRAFNERFNSFPTLPDVKTYVQTPNPDPFSMVNSIRKAVGIGSELIICYGTQAAFAAKKEARGTPVLFADVYDPVSLGLVLCLDDVACGISGISGSTPVNTLLKALTKTRHVDTLGILYSSTDPGSLHQYKILRQIAPGFGMRVLAEDIANKKQLQSSMDRLSSSADVLFVSDSSVVQQNVDFVMEQALKQGFLVVSQIPGLAEKGALMTLEPDPAEQGEKLADYAYSVLGGTKVETLAVETPHKVNLVVNLKIARRHNLKIPFEVLTMTTKVIK